MQTTARIIATGGTFDKRYDPIAGKLTFGTTHVHSILAKSRLNSVVAVTELPLQDSLDMQDVDRMRVLNTCKNCEEKRIVIIHGTDTMPETAQVLGQAALSKTIVITGAMVPYDLVDSDAQFNLGFAMSAVQLLSSGVYIAMGAEVFAWDNVRKNKVVGQFETLR